MQGQREGSLRIPPRDPLAPGPQWPNAHRPRRRIRRSKEGLTRSLGGPVPDAKRLMRSSTGAHHGWLFDRVMGRKTRTQSHARRGNKVSFDREAYVRSDSGCLKAQTLLQGLSSGGHREPTPVANLGEPSRSRLIVKWVVKLNEFDHRYEYQGSSTG
ncbi:hypothetical protein LIER_04100 [Lithospermum erythrorhizon]|uniref:Uncharacterized protein n=1 Tax=Lithospermum erythrorhizon TaxID=34254 RepID=A0AAV3NVL9_LITER